tara:strand:+ start:904 stop:1995 length:1092 start_codon:yes stop_codon:yes gene_type:complete
MAIEDQFAKAFGGEVAGTEAENNNVVDLTSNQDEGVEQQEQQTVTEDDSNVIDLTSDSSLNNEETTNVDEFQGDQQVEGEEISDDEVVLQYLSEKLGRDLTSFDDLNITSTQAESGDFASEQLRVINEYVKNTGRTVQDYLNTQTVDLSNVSDDAVMKEYLRLDNPNLTEAELNDYMAATYKMDKDEYTTRDMNAGKVQLMKDAKAAREYFNKVKEDYAMPTESASPEVSEQERTEWLGQMESEVDDLEGLSFEMNDQGEEFIYNLDDNARQEIKGYNSNLENFFDKYIDEGGNWDFDALNTDMYILNNMDKIVRGVANQYRSKGTESVINEIKNPSFTQDKQGAPQKQRSTLDMLRDEIWGK